MTEFVITAPETASVAVAGSSARFPVRRVCVGRNYAAHAREMGSDPNREPPFLAGRRPVRSAAAVRCHIAIDE